MKIYNQEKTQILENPDLKKGYLIQDQIVVKTIPATEEVQEQSHYEYKDYLDENGNVYGQDKIKIIDVAYKPAKPETYEYEDIWVYILFTEEQLKNNRIAEIKQQLEELNKDFIQKMLGADFGTKVLNDGTEINVFEKKKSDFISLHNELRELEGKDPREYKN